MWNTRDPARVALGYSPDSPWRNRAEFFQGREAITAFLTRKWGLPSRELHESSLAGISENVDQRLARIGAGVGGGVGI